MNSYAQEINTANYWDNRFSAGSWEEASGKEQTVFFGQLALQNIPQWFSDFITEKKLSICDFGCALGQSTDMLKTYFPENKIYGRDISQEAIKKAKKDYPNIHFSSDNILDRDFCVDVIFSSNTLEHFYNPKKIMEELSQKANTFLWFLLPFYDNSNHKEHFFRFTYQNLPYSINNNFTLAFYKEIDTSELSNTQWFGKQILIIYANKKIIENLEKITSSDLLLRTKENYRNEMIKMDFQEKHQKIIYENQLQILKDQHYQKALTASVSFSNQLQEVEQEKNRLLNQYQQIEQKNNLLLNEYQQIEQENKKQKKIISQLEESNEALQKDLQKKAALLNEKLIANEYILSSVSWKITSPLRIVRRKVPVIFTAFKKNKTSNTHKRLKNAMRKYGLNGSSRIIKDRFKHKIYSIVSMLHTKKFVSFLQSQPKDKPIIVYPPFMSWNIPMQQRPNHVATALASAGYPFLYFTNGIFESIRFLKPLRDNLYIANQNFFSILHNTPEKKVFILHPNHQNFYSIESIKKLLKQKNTIIYDFLDHPEVFHLKEFSLHDYIMRNEDIIILCTAESLLEEALSYRRKNVYYVPNAAWPLDFQKINKEEILQKICPSHEAVIKDIFTHQKKIIGYVGALAKWFDYTLIEKIAENIEGDTHILLIGQNYDGSLDKHPKLKQYNNISFLGTIPYPKLKYYTSLFSCSMIPFIKNTITNATSPVKLFEYMNLGIPIVTSDMPECRKYKSAMVAKNHEEFLMLIDKALKIPKDNEYFNIMKKEAAENTWDTRAKVIIDAINENSAIV